MNYFVLPFHKFLTFFKWKFSSAQNILDRVSCGWNEWNQFCLLQIRHCLVISKTVCLARLLIISLFCLVSSLNHFISTSLSYWLPGTFLQSSSCFFCSSNSKDAARIFFASLHASSVTDTRQVVILMKKIIIKLVYKKIGAWGFIAPFRADFKNENRFFFQ